MQPSPARPTRLSVLTLEAREVPAVLYVATDGSDSNPGTSDAPLQTIQTAANRVVPGDTVFVRAGQYRGFNVRTSGTTAARITFQADPAASKGSVVINLPNPWNLHDGINMEAASHITIEGFKVVNQPRAGIRAVNNEFVVVRNNIADNNRYWGVFTGFSSDLLVENNETSRSQLQHGIYVSNSGDRPTVRGNYIWGNAASGLQLNADASMGGDGIITGALLEQNIIRDNGVAGGASINLDGVQSSIIRNNIISNAMATGIALFRWDGASGSQNNLVANNTVLAHNPVNVNNGRWALSIADGSTGNRLVNNVLHSSHGYRGAIAVTADSLPGLVSNNNAAEDFFSTDGGNSWFGLAQWRALTGQDSNSLTFSDPSTIFVNASQHDFHLRSGSPAIDHGMLSGASPTDFEGTPRPTGAGVDIGADEFDDSSGGDPGDPGPGFYDDFSSAVPKPEWTFASGNWVQSGGILRQTGTAPADPQKAVIAGLPWAPSQEIVADVRVDGWVNGDHARAGVGVRTNSAGLGYNLVFHGPNRVQFLNDLVVWGNGYDFAWNTGVWYTFKLLAEADGTLRGKVWETGQAEPAAWMFTQTGWTGRTSGSPALNGGSSGQGYSTVSFDNLAARDLPVLFADDFSGSSPGSAWSFASGSWTQSNGVLAQNGTSTADPKKAIVTGLPAGAANEVEARVRVDSWMSGDRARAGVGLGTDSAGRGYNLVFHGQNRVEFLHDHVRWGNGFSFTWQAGTWYHFKLRQEADGTLRGKVWADGQAEPASWQFTQTGWAYRTGWASLNGGSAAVGQGSSTASFDDVVVRA